MDFYYSISAGKCKDSDYELNQIIQYSAKPGQRAQQKTVLDLPIDSDWRRFFATKDYIVYCKHTYTTCLYDRKAEDDKDIHITDTCTHSHFIVNGQVFYHNQENGATLNSIKLDDVLNHDVYDKDRVTRTLIKTASSSSSSWADGDRVIHSNGGFYTIHRSGISEGRRMQWLIINKTSYNGETREVGRAKHTQDHLYFDVCDDIVYAVVDEVDEHSASIYNPGNQVIKRINTRSIEDFPVFRGFSHLLLDRKYASSIVAIQATRWIIALLIREKDKGVSANFYDLNGQLLRSEYGNFKNIFKVANGAFVVTSDHASYLYEWQRKSDGTMAPGAITGLSNKKILWVQPKLDF